MTLNLSTWNEYTLEEICTKVTDGTHDSPPLVESGFPLIKGKDISQGFINFESCDHISEVEHIQIMKRSKPEFGDILFANIGNSIGDCVYVNTNKEFSIKNVALFKPDLNKVASKFLFYVTSGQQFIGEILNRKSGSAQPFVSLASLRRHKVHIPSLPTQQKIARILSAYDDLIEHNLKRIKLLEEMAQITYEEWFIRMKFPGHEQAVPDPETGLPVGWNEIFLGKACDVSGGGTPSKEVNEYWEHGETTWFSPTDLSKANNLVLMDSTSKITKLGLQKSSAKLMQPNSFMMTSRATIGLFGVINKPFSTNQGFINVTPYESNHKYFLLFNFKSRVQEFYNHASGATFPEISKSKFKRLKINWPPGKLLQSFHLKVSPLIDLITNLTEQNKDLKEARDILLPRLMNGMIDVDTLDLPETLKDTEFA